eukprot:tig00000158_g10143.t1
MLLCDLSSLRLARGAGTCSTETRARERGPRARRIAHHRPRLRLCRIIGEPAEGARCGRICRDLDLSALIEDDNGMELLVAGQIVRLDLSIRQVYEQVWRRSLGGDQAGDGPPMVVTYRLQGLDGEATEPIVDALEDTAGPERDPEEEFAAAAVMAPSGGLDALLAQIRSFRTLDVNADLVALVLRLARHCALLAANRARMLALGGVRVLLDVLRLAFADERHADEAEALLLTLESLVEAATAAAVAPDAAAAASGGDRERLSDAAVVSQLRMFLEKLTSPLVKTHRRVATTMTRVLQFLTYGRAPAMELIADYFAPHLDWEALAGPLRSDAQARLLVECAVKFADAIRDDANGQRLKDLILARGVPGRAAAFLAATVPPRKFTEGDAEWAAALASPALPSALLLLTGLCRGHPATQRVLLETNVLPLCHFLEQITQGGSKADAGVREAVRALRDATRREKRKLALAKREKLLADLGMRLDAGGESGAGGGGGGEAGDAAAPEAGPSGAGGGGRIVASRVPGALAGPAAWRPSTRRRRPAGPWGRAGRLGPGEAGVASSSHFNTIHFACHRDATRAERSLKVPREEWDGATLRNNQTRCNNLYPLAGPLVPADAYAQATDRFWQQAAAALGRLECGAPAARLRLALHDARLLLARLAHREAFAGEGETLRGRASRTSASCPTSSTPPPPPSTPPAPPPAPPSPPPSPPLPSPAPPPPSPLPPAPASPRPAAAAARRAPRRAPRRSLRTSARMAARTSRSSPPSSSSPRRVARPPPRPPPPRPRRRRPPRAPLRRPARLRLLLLLLLLPRRPALPRPLFLLRPRRARGGLGRGGVRRLLRSGVPRPARVRAPAGSEAAGDGDAVAALCERVRADERPVLASSRRIAEAYAAACAAAAPPAGPAALLAALFPEAAEEAAAEGGLEALVERAAGDR